MVQIVLYLEREVRCQHNSLVKGILLRSVFFQLSEMSEKGHQGEKALQNAGSFNRS